MRRISASTRFNDGFTLLEVIIALTILTLVALGTSHNLTQTRQISESNIRESTVLAIVSGYIEQIKSMEYELILESIEDNSIPLPTRLSHGIDDPIYLNSWNDKEVVIDMDKQTGDTVTMNLSILPVVRDVSSKTFGKAINIHMEFKWKNAQGGNEIQKNLRTQRSYVPTF